MEVNDIDIDGEGEIDVTSGDFKISASDQMHIEHILISNKGYWFEHPLLGVGLIDDTNSPESTQELKQLIRRQLVFDEFSVKKISISSDKEIDINAVRKK